MIRTKSVVTGEGEDFQRHNSLVLKYVVLTDS